MKWPEALAFTEIKVSLFYEHSERDHGSFHQAPNLSSKRNTVLFIRHCFRLGSLAAELQNALLKMKVVHL